MRVLRIEPKKVPEVVDIDLGLESLQKQVDGYIEAVYPFEDEIALIVNEEGKYNGSEPNRALRDYDGNIYDIIFGTFLVVGLTENNFGELSEEKLAKYSELYQKPKEYLKINHKIIEIPY